MNRRAWPLWRYRDLLRLLVSRDIKLKYRRSLLGYLWSVLDPLLIMAVMTVVFSTMFSRSIPHFPVYLFCGQLLFHYMSRSTHQAVFSVTGNGALLKKASLPKYIFTVAKITAGTAELLFSLGALVIVIPATGAGLYWTALLFPLVLLQLYLFCTGLGLLLAQANVFFRDTQFVYNAVTTAWQYLTPIFYPLEALPEWLQWAVSHLNPMYFYVAQFRCLVYTGTMPEAGLVLAGWGVAGAMLAVGAWSFQRSQDKFILYL